MFEIFSMQISVKEVQVYRICFFGIFYVLARYVLYVLFLKKDVSSYLYIVLAPYLALALSVFGLWLIGLAVEYFWLFVPGALISELGRKLILKTI